jgi:hypothetical protein
MVTHNLEQALRSGTRPFYDARRPYYLDLSGTERGCGPKWPTLEDVLGQRRSAFADVRVLLTGS